MKITDLERFRFNIGNTFTNVELDVVATNEGILVDEELDGRYDDNDIIDAHDLCNAIDDALLNCSTLTSEEKEELGTYLGADVDIENWWGENYN